MTITPPPPVDGTSQPAPLAAQKISPTDPRLRLRQGGRTLRTGPVLAVAAALVAVAVFATLIALSPDEDPKANTAEKPPPPPRAAIPEEVQQPPPPAKPRTPPPPTDRLSVEPLPENEAAYRSGANTLRLAAAERAQRENEEDTRARAAGLLFESAATLDAATPAAASSSTSPLSAASELAALLNQPPASPTAPGSTNAAMPSAEADPNGQQGKSKFLATQRSSDYLQTQVLRPRSPYEVKAGTVIPAVLITAINSDLPGPVVGQVRENVFDTVSGNYLLIPQGSRLLASYDSMVAWGQERVLVCWHRLIFPNGDSINLECMPAADLKGAAGLADEVDEHWGRIIKAAAVASLLAATSQAVAGNTTSFVPTVPQTWARNAAGEVNQVGQQITRRNMNIQPTITVRPGFSVNVMVTKDMIVPPYGDYNNDSLFSAAGY